jgi:hypothetical protein
VAGAIGFKVEGGERAGDLERLERRADDAVGGEFGAGSSRFTGPAPAMDLCAPSMRPLAMSRQPRKSTPMPSGQVTGVTSSASVSAISSRSASGSTPSRSTLLMKVMMGMSRSRQTSNSLSVWDSMPLAASITMMAESTAVSVR